MMARTTITRPPIRVLRTTTQGWRDIAVRVEGGGILPGYEAVLRFNGAGYPSNPSLAPRAQERPAGAVVIAVDARAERLD
jgi:hypothetical protein